MWTTRRVQLPFTFPTFILSKCYKAYDPISEWQYVYTNNSILTMIQIYVSNIAWKRIGTTLHSTTQ